LAGFADKIGSFPFLTQGYKLIIYKGLQTLNWAVKPYIASFNGI